MVGRLQLQRLLRGIKRVQGTNQTKRLPITSTLLQLILQSLDLSIYEHAMLWAACCLGFFGFLRAGEFTINSLFDPDIHITVQDIQVDSRTDPSSIRVHPKGSKTDPFRQGCHIYLRQGRYPICPISAMLTYLHLRGSAALPLFIHLDGRPLSRQQLSSFLQSTLQAAGVPGHYSSHSFRIGVAPTAEQRGIQIT